VAQGDLFNLLNCNKKIIGILLDVKQGFQFSGSYNLINKLESAGIRGEWPLAYSDHT